MFMNPIMIYTDGACKGNPGPGGWGCFLHYPNEYKEYVNGFEKNTTNNQMELTAVIKALEFVHTSDPIVLHTDSNYVYKGVTEWLSGWKKKGWKTSTNRPVKNVELWKKLDSYLNRFSITWKHVPAHSGIPGNEKADELANLAISSNM
jgi:ribonuclease HI